KVLALCIDHALQAGSDKVAETAAAHARRWGAEAQVIAVEITPDSPAGMEAEARRVRYQAFAQATQTMQEEGTSRGEKLAVFVAHTAEDQAETVLLSALRGHLSAMSHQSEIEGARIVRPLLPIRRANTQGACAELEDTPWEDPHNQREDLRRVAIRKQVRLILAEVIGGVANALLAVAGDNVASDEDDFSALSSAHEEYAEQSVEKRNELDCKALLCLDHP